MDGIKFGMSTVAETSIELPVLSVIPSGIRQGLYTWADGRRGRRLIGKGPEIVLEVVSQREGEVKGGGFSTRRAGGIEIDKAQLMYL